VNESVYSNRSEAKSGRNQTVEGGPLPTSVKSKQEVRSVCGDSKNSIKSPTKVVQVPVKDSSKSVKNSVGSHAQIK
jgi:hypothetical protein